jgi:hypothetical protein
VALLATTGSKETEDQRSKRNVTAEKERDLLFGSLPPYQGGRIPQPGARTKLHAEGNTVPTGGLDPAHVADDQRTGNETPLVVTDHEFPPTGELSPQNPATLFLDNRAQAPSVSKQHDALWSVTWNLDLKATSIDQPGQHAGQQAIIFSPDVAFHCAHNGTASRLLEGTTESMQVAAKHEKHFCQIDTLFCAGKRLHLAGDALVYFVSEICQGCTWLEDTGKDALTSADCQRRIPRQDFGAEAQ